MIANKINYLVDKYEGDADKVAIRGTIESKEYGVKVIIHVMDRNPVPIDVVNLTVRLMFEGELPLLDKFITSVDFAIANILDLYDQNALPEIDIPEIETDEAADNV